LISNSKDNEPLALPEHRDRLPLAALPARVLDACAFPDCILQINDCLLQMIR